MPPSTINPAPGRPASTSSAVKTADFLSVFFFAALFFLCSADQFFTFHIRGFNFRFGQLLLLGCSILSLREIALDVRKDPSAFGKYWLPVKNWVPFFLVYAAAASFSRFPAHTFLKLGWALFNIGGALLLFLNRRWAAPLRRGIFWGILAIAVTLWLQLIAIYTLGATAVMTPQPSASQALSFARLQGFPFGFVQNTRAVFDGVLILRPNAFYYEPSYAGCALAFAFPLVFLLVLEKNSWKALLVPALVLGAVFFTTSRGGILCAATAVTLMFLAGFIRKQKKLLAPLVHTLLLSVLLAGAALLSSHIRDYIGFLAGPLGPSAIVSHIGNPRLSEGYRVANLRNALHLWMEHPLLGNGVLRSVDKHSTGFGFVSESMWLEVAVESGLLGLLAFGWAILKSVRDPLKGRPVPAHAVPVLAAVAAHLLVDMNVTTTFPRLDYWLLFFLAVSLLRPESRPAPQNPAMQ